jgi:hypothetical protein
MGMGGQARLGNADQYGAAHAAPGALGLAVIIPVVAVMIVLGKRGK